MNQNDICSNHFLSKKRMILNYKNFINFLLDFLILFGFIFESPIISIITTRRLAIFISLIYLFLHYQSAKKIFKYINKIKFLIFTINLTFCLFIVLINNMDLYYVAGNVYYNFTYIIYFFVYVVVFSVFCVIRFKNIINFSKVYISIMIFQSIIVFVSATNYDFRMFIYNNFYFSDDRFAKTIEWGSRVIGINLHSAIGSVILCTGCIALIYLGINKKITNLKFICSYMLIMTATIFIGRTGLYLEMLSLFFYFCLNIKNIKNIMSIIIVCILLIILLQFVLSKMENNIADYFMKWAGELLNSDTRLNTINILSSMEYPKFSIEMIFGTNIMYGIVPGGNLMISDSGYLKIYCSIGVIGSMLYYSSFIFLFFSVWNYKNSKKNKLFFLYIGLLNLIIEYKEPFIQKYIFIWFLFLIMLFDKKYETDNGGGIKWKR